MIGVKRAFLSGCLVGGFAVLMIVFVVASHSPMHSTYGDPGPIHSAYRSPRNGVQYTSTLDTNLNGVDTQGEEIRQLLTENPEPRIAGYDATVPGQMPRPWRVLATTNTGYLAYTQNWLASLKRSGIHDNITIVCDDREAYTKLRKLPDETLDLQLAPNARSIQGVVRHGSSPYLELVNRRPSYILHFLKHGVDVLFSDVDVVLFQNPMPYFHGDYDIHLQTDLYKRDNDGHADIYCAGFIYFAATDATRAFLLKLIERIEVAPKTTIQNTLNYLLRDKDVRKSLRLRTMEADLFVSGKYFFNDDWRRKYVRRRPVMIHNNWVNSTKDKYERFKQFGMWFV